MIVLRPAFQLCGSSFGAVTVGSDLQKFQTDSTKVITALKVLPVVTAIHFWKVWMCTVVCLCLLIMMVLGIAC